MLGSFDYYGAAALVAAIGAVLTTVLGFLNRGKVAEIHSTTTDTAAKVETTAAQVETTAANVETLNGKTIGAIASDADATADELAKAHGTTNPPPSSAAWPPKAG